MSSQSRRRGLPLTPELKEILLKRKFSSIEYMREMVEAHGLAVEALEEGLDQFFAKYPDEEKWPPHCMPDVWQWRVLTNFKRMQGAMERSLEDAKRGDNWRMSSVVGSLRGLSKDMDGISWDLWNYIDKETTEKFSRNLGKAEQHGENLYWTLDDGWNPAEVLDEEITGPIDEQELLKYLKPGEKA
jgi:hypothetical protein